MPFNQLKYFDNDNDVTSKLLRLQLLSGQHRNDESRFDVTNKFQNRINILLWNKVLWFAVVSHITSFNELECITLQKTSYLILNLVHNFRSFQYLSISVTRKKSPNVYKSYPKMISLKNDRFWHLYKNCLRLWEIWPI